MDTEADSPSIATEPEPSLLRGGPFYRAQLAARLVRPDDCNHVGRVTLAILIGWLPLILITVVLNPGGLPSFLKDYRVHSRMLIAVPVLLLGPFLMESRFRDVVRYITAGNLLGAEDEARLRAIIAQLLRLRDSLIPEAMIVLLLVVHTLTTYRGLVDVTPWLSYGTEHDVHLTPAGWHAVLVGTTLFQFLAGLGLWKWLLWTVFAFKLSRLDLKLVASHPDGHGGLGFLGLMPVGFAPVSFAVATVIGATWRHEILHHGANLMSFKLAAIALLVIVAAFALGPLVFFVPRLAALRRRGILDYGILGQIQSADFHEKWILHRTGHETEFLTAVETIALNAFGQFYEKLKQMNPFPADKVGLIALGGSVALPMLPVVLAVIPLMEVLKDLLKALR